MPTRRFIGRTGQRSSGERGSGSRPSCSPGDLAGARLAKGSTNKQIARTLGITDKMVSIHVSNILAKLGCTTRTQAAGFRDRGALGSQRLKPKSMHQPVLSHLEPLGGR